MSFFEGGGGEDEFLVGDTVVLGSWKGCFLRWCCSHAQGSLLLLACFFPHISVYVYCYVYMDIRYVWHKLPGSRCDTKRTSQALKCPLAARFGRWARPWAMPRHRLKVELVTLERAQWENWHPQSIGATGLKAHVVPARFLIFGWNHDMAHVLPGLQGAAHGTGLYG